MVQQDGQSEQEKLDKAFEGAKQFSEKYVESSPYVFFPEQEVVEEVQKGLALNQVNQGFRYCP